MGQTLKGRVMDSNGGRNAVPEQPFSHLITEHSKRFDRIDSDNGKLEERISELEARMNQLSPLIERMDSDLYNHGKDGLKTKFDKFTAVQDDRHRENSQKMNLVIAILALLCSIFMAILAWKGLAKTAQIVTDPFHSRIPVIAVSERVR